MASMTTANRTSGVAPLLVFFDAVDVVTSGPGVAQSTPASPWLWSSGVVQPADYEGTLYEWDFGDPTSGTWTTTGLSRNTATGFTAAHVYETPGTYAATLIVTEVSGTVTTYTQSITVSAASGTTYYVAASPTGNDANNGTSTVTPFATVAKGLSMAGANRSILFRRGDTWTTAAFNLTAAGPGILGAYGTGARPIFNSTAPNDSNNATNVISINSDDQRVVDIELRGTGWNGIQFNTHRGLALRCFTNCTSVGNYYIGFGGGGPGTNPNDGCGLVECESSATGGYGVYLMGRRQVVMGNYFHDIRDSHVLRIPAAHRGVVSNNKLWNPGATRHAIKMHSHIATDGSYGWTQFVTLSDNNILGDTWSVGIGPQDSISDERVSHIVYERNRHDAKPAVQVEVIVWADDFLARNNVMNATNGGLYPLSIAIGRRGIEPAHTRNRFYNNTFARTGASSEFYAIQLSTDVTNVTVKNNLTYAPSGIVATTSGSAGSGFTQSNNVASTTSPNFTNAAGGDFRLSATTPGTIVNAGATLPEVRQDFLRLLRPAGAAYDIGAYEYGAGGPQAYTGTVTETLAPDALLTVVQVSESVRESTHTLSGNTPVQLDTSALSNRRLVRVVNPSSTTRVFIGHSLATTNQTNCEIAGGVTQGIWEDLIGSGVPIYAVSESGAAVTIRLKQWS